VLEQPTPDPMQILAAGYGPIPLPAMRKGPPKISGHHGPGAEPIGDLDVFDWQARGLFGNVGVVLPVGVLGVDVDAYKTPEAWQLWQELSTDWPATVCLTARNDGKSGIRLYRFEGIDDERFWGSRSGIDIITHRVRYLTAPGSTHPLGMTYRVIDERDGTVSFELPAVDTLPELSIHQAGRLVKQSTGLYAVPTISRQTSRRRPDNEPACAEVLNALARAREHLTDGTGRHPAMASATTALARLEFDGHPGVEATLKQLAGEFVAAMIAEPRAGEDERTWRAEFASMVISARGKCGGPDDRTPTPEAQRGCVGIMPVLEHETELKVPRLPESFWSADSSLATIRQAARFHLIGPDGLLLSCVQRALCSLPTDWVLPAIVGAEAAPNLFVAMVTASGGGKSVTATVAADLIPLKAPLDFASPADDTNRGTVLEVPIGTAEGMTSAFGRIVGKAKAAHWVKGHWALLVDADEIDRFMKMADWGSGMTAWLREASHGRKQLGATQKNLPTPIAAFDYRLCLMLGAQPGRIAPLLGSAEASAGTPQRFIFTTAVGDPIDAEAPRPLDWAPMPVGIGAELAGPSRTVLDSGGHEHELYSIPVAEPIRAEIRAARKRSMRRAAAGDELDSHRNLNRLIVAVGLGLIRRPGTAPRVTEADWQLAGMVMSCSDEVRDWMLEIASSESVGREAGRVELKRAGEAEASQRLATVAARILAHVTEREGQTISDLRRRQQSDRRPLFDQALPRLIASGQLTEDEGRISLSVTE